MNSILRRLAMLAALGTVGVLAPVAGASAAVTPSLPLTGLPSFPTTGLPSLPTTGLPSFPTTGLPSLPTTGLPSFPTTGLPAATGLPALPPLTFVGPSVGQVAAVIGPTVITTAPSNFVNTNIQTSAGGNATGGQAAP